MSNPSNNFQLSELSRYVELSEVALILSADCTELQSFEVCRLLGSMHDRLDFYLGDWSVEHEKRWGKESMQRGLKQFEFSFVDAYKAATTASIPPESRRIGLSIRHHAAVARHAENPQDMQTWLSTAEGNDLTPGELTRSMRGGRIIQDKKRGNTVNHGGVHTVTKVIFDFRLWLKAAEADGRVSTWNEKDRRALLNELAPVKAFIEGLAKSLES